MPIFLNNKLNYKRDLSFNNPLRTLSINAASNDPYFSNVVLFLQGNGVNNSTTIIDSSPTPKTITVSGNTKISTDQSIYGGSSILFDGSGDYLNVTSNDLILGTSDFTIEVWLRRNAIVAWESVCLIGSNVSNIGMYLVSSQLVFYEGGSLASISNVSASVFHHLAIVRSSGVLKSFLNGVGSSTATRATNYTGNICRIGANRSGDEAFSGYLDSLRITKGIARYSANFNPETDTFLNV